MYFRQTMPPKEVSSPIIITSIAMRESWLCQLKKRSKTRTQVWTMLQIAHVAKAGMVWHRYDLCFCPALPCTTHTQYGEQPGSLGHREEWGKFEGSCVVKLYCCSCPQVCRKCTCSFYELVWSSCCEYPNKTILNPSLNKTQDYSLTHITDSSLFSYSYYGLTATWGSNKLH